MDSIEPVVFRVEESSLRHVSLGGEFSALLTVDERNEWAEYVMDAPEWRDLQLATAWRDAVVHDREPDQASVAYAVSGYLERQRDIYRLARRWYETVILPRREPEKGADHDT